MKCTPSPKELTHLDKIIAIGFTTGGAIMWGIYGKDILKALPFESWWNTKHTLAIIFAACTAISCIVYWCCKKLYWCILPWLIVFTLLLTMDFQWYTLLPGLCVFIVLIYILWPQLSKDNGESPSIQRDLLGMEAIYSEYAGIIKSYITTNPLEEKQKGCSVAVTGVWGCGKTHCIESIISKLHKSYEGKIRIKRIDLWQYPDVKTMWQNVAQALWNMLNGYSQDMNKLYLKIIQCLFSLIPWHSNLDATDIVNFFSGKDEGTIVSKKLHKSFKESSLRYILVIDNIERCNKTIQRKAFSLIDRINKLPNLIILCGIANGNMATAIGGATDDIREALIKAFDIQLPVPLCQKEQLTQYIKEIIEKLKNGKECKHAEHWLLEQDFFYLPIRIVQKIASRLILIDNSFLSRLDDDYLYDEIGEACGLGTSLANTIFAFETLRVAYPYLPLPYKDNRSHEDDEHNKDDENNAYSRWENDVRNMCSISPANAFNNLANTLFKGKPENLEYIAKQEYLRISALTPKECKLVLDNDTEETSPANTIYALFRNKYLKKDESELIRCVCRYIANHPQTPNARRFLCKLTDPNTLPAHFVTNAIVAEEGVHDETMIREEWKKIRNHARTIYSINTLKKEVEAILKYKHCNEKRLNISYDISPHLSDSAKQLLHLYDADKNKETEQKLSAVCNKLVQEYAWKACSHICAHIESDNATFEYAPLRITQTVYWKQYGKYIEDGTMNFIKSHAFKGNEEKLLNRLLKIVVIRDISSKTLRTSDMLFAVLPFMVIWAILFQKFFNNKATKANIDKVIKIRHLISKHMKNDLNFTKEKRDHINSELLSNRRTSFAILRHMCCKLERQMQEKS